MTSKITRRSFIRLSLAIPFAGVLPWYEQHNHFLMPFEAWGIFASLSLATRRFSIAGGFLSAASASVLTSVVIKAWNDIPWYLDLFNGIQMPSDGFEHARKWLTGDGWERRLRGFLGFVRQGAFRVERQGHQAVLRRGQSIDFGGDC